MIADPSEIIERNKIIKRLITTWKKNHDIRQKALLLMQMNPSPKVKKIEDYPWEKYPNQRETID